MNNAYHIEIYKELSTNVQRHIDGDGIHQTTISSLSIIKSSTLTVPTHVLYQPAFCIILQGRKEAVLADQVLYYGVGDYLVASVDLPVKGQVIEATESEPYLCLRLDIDPYVLYEVLTASGLSLTNRNRIPRGLFVEKMDDGLIDSVTRLIKLLDKPNDISVLADLLIREIYYRLLSGPQGHAVSNAALIGTKMQRISQAIQHIKQEVQQTCTYHDLVRDRRNECSLFSPAFQRCHGDESLAVPKEPETA
ncbi:AraC family transcriptional regulator [Methylovorus sp. MM2]|uniref:AraC family transcriptional regulator n=1 Tax=Methylovorus sp. MM2 TaxID=1848038 RepID=UPI000AC4CB12|nr:AraC family transcriptional regulator [Methylovorus sp. MM2]